MGVMCDTAIAPLDSSLAVPSPVEFSATLLPLLPLPAGGGFTANSCAPGMGGGKKDEEGEGNGEELGGAST